MNDDEYRLLQKKVLRTKKDLKKWEHVFEEKHGRPVTVKDISERPNIEKFYKKYNQLKKELQKESEAREKKSSLKSDQTTLVSDVDSQQTADSQASTQSVHLSRQLTHENISIVGSLQPSDLDRINSFMTQDGSQQDHLNMNEVNNDLKNSLTSSPTMSLSKVNGRPLTEEEAFWLETTSTSSSTTATTTASPTSTIISFSQPLPPKTNMLDEEDTVMTDVPSTQQPRLILGSSQSRKNPYLLKTPRRIHNPYLRRQQLNQQAKQQHQNSLKQYFMTQQPLLEGKPNHYTVSMSQPIDDYYSDSMRMKLTESDDDDDEPFKIEEHKINPFRHYDPSLFHSDDPTFSVGPGFFNSNKVYRSFMIPFLNEPSRRKRVLMKLKKGTLGLVSAENKAMEEDIDEDLRHFIEMNNMKNPNNFESSITPIDEKVLNDIQPVYKKKPLQKRQTKLYKLKFVNT
ncbi:uncharacterized protein BX663DRAFT_498745 [Cokeromyces recurvatus]|uniref:uncharacterized protein n=1 Tax=Cokeromyces recurvatus TaxID=90255 RepID=UPI00221FAD9D|nr:uncharacterized protein BX663DRAFT_498745 [Cokeromyces recurvatus]KAI7906089.1 hypothetical protein BX663DRAFT_498745 [Cokeromyces recurvatus]